MKDFRSYREEDGARRAAQNAADRTAGQGAAGGEGQKTPDGKPAESEAAELARKALAAYNGRSEGAVLAEIVKQAEAMKRAGTLSNDELDAFYRQFSPLAEKDMKRAVGFCRPPFSAGACPRKTEKAWKKRGTAFLQAAHGADEDGRLFAGVEGGEGSAHRAVLSRPQRSVHEGRAVQPAAHRHGKFFGQQGGDLFGLFFPVRKGDDAAGIGVGEEGQAGIGAQPFA